jgi:hypothetical protein
VENSTNARRTKKKTSTKTIITTNSLDDDELARDQKIRKAFIAITKFHEEGNFEKCKEKAKKITDEIKESEVKDFFQNKFKGKIEKFKQYFEE